MSKKNSSRHKWHHDAIAGLIVRSMHFLARLSDRRMIGLLKGVAWLFAKADKKHPALEAINDIRDIFENSTEGNRALRAILLDGRPNQARSMIRGLLRHYSGVDPLPLAGLAQSLQEFSVDMPFRVGLYGRNDESPWLHQEYAGSAFFAPVVLDEKKPDFERLDAVELASLTGLSEKQLEALFSKKIPVSLSYAAIDKAHTAQRLFSLAGKYGTPLRVLYSCHYYQPILKAKELIDAGEIGEVTLLRVRATVGRGDATAPSIHAKTDVLTHEGFNHLPLLAFFGGTIEKTAAYLNPMNAKKGGQALVNCKFAYPGRYGLLECTYAPDLYLCTSHLPYDLEAEIVGSDGTLWISRGMSDRIQTPPIRVRIGQTSYTIGLETGMEHQWDHVYRFMVLEMAAMVLKQTRPALAKAELLSALAARDAAGQSNRQRKVIAV